MQGRFLNAQCDIRVQDLDAFNIDGHLAIKVTPQSVNEGFEKIPLIGRPKNAHKCRICSRNELLTFGITETSA